MSQIRVNDTLSLGKGSDLYLYEDYSKPEDSLDRRWTEVTYDGEEGSVPFNVQPHWHKYHDEYMTVLYGKVEVTIDGKTQILEGDPNYTFQVRRWQTHAIKAFKGVPLRMRERTDPAGDFKPDFFRDLLSEGASPPFLHAMRAFYDGDGFPALPMGIKLLDQMFVYFFGGIAKLVLPARDASKKSK